jgi:hypothetical protein
MPLSLSLFTHGLFRTLTVVIVVSIINPWLLLALGVAIIAMFFISRQGANAMI